MLYEVITLRLVLGLPGLEPFGDVGPVPVVALVPNLDDAPDVGGLAAVEEDRGFLGVA